MAELTRRRDGQADPESLLHLAATVATDAETAALATTEERAAENLAPSPGPLQPAPFPRTDRPPPAAGSIIGPYELIRTLGQGGMGTVFLARDTRLGRLVAIKLLTTLSGPGAQRFLAEARATARCKHENIVVIHEVDEHDGYPYMVLEYLEGQTLRAFMDERRPEGATADIATAPLPPRMALEIIIPVVRALACAHKLGIVHRDLKPENIVLDASGPIKVLDFGIAKEQDSDSLLTRGEGSLSIGESLGLTREGAILGTLPYMSPEHWGADAIDPRSDLWAVGIMLYELVTGRHPLAPLSILALARVADLGKPMPSVSEAHPSLGPLCAPVDRCLRKRKAERIASAAELLADLEALLRGQQSVALVDDESPFAGLLPFQETDAPRFFGRERDITSALGRLRHHALLAIAGPSGAGKSSFVRAGIIPALKRSGEGWDTFILRPGRRPLAALVELCAQLSPDAEDSQALHRLLRDVPGYLGATLRARGRRAGHRTLLFVDQFEELYTLGADKDERAAFLACLEGVADDASSPLRLVLSVRSDFLDRMVDDPHLLTAITRGLFFLPPLGRDGLREALLRPIQAAGHGFESEDMVEAMLDALETTASPLPLLQFTAAKLWDKRDHDRRLLTRQSYDALGGVEGALATHADAVVAGLSAREQRLARAIFLRLVTLERTRAVARLADVRELDEDGDAALRVASRLAEARLLLIEARQGDITPNEITEERDGATVELVHESLIHRWPKLRQWLDENQEEGAFLARLRAAARQWEANGRAEGLLWRGQVADDAQRWLTRLRTGSGAEEQGASMATLGAREERYLRAVVTRAERARRRRAWLTAGAVGILGGVSLVVSLLAVRASVQARRADSEAFRAEEQARRADREASHARAEAVQARNATRMATAREFMEDPTTVIALVREFEPGGKPRGWAEFAHWALQSGVARAVLSHPDTVRDAAFSPDGKRIVTACVDKAVRVFHADGSGDPLILRGHEEQVNSAAFSPDGKRIITASADRTARIWSADGSGDPLILRGHEEQVNSAAFSPDGKRIVTASTDRTARIWNADGRGEPVVLRAEGQDLVYTAAFSPDGKRVVTASFDKTARVWNTDGKGEPLILKGHGFAVRSAAFSPDGKNIVTASADSTARIWNADGRGEPLILRGHTDGVTFAAFSPDGQRIVTASYDKTARIWSADGRGEPQVLRGHENAIRSAMFSASGKHIVTASFDATARVWNADGSGEALVLKGHETSVAAAAFSPDGKRIVTGSYDATARVWSGDGHGKPLILRGHDGPVLSVAFSPDGQRIVTASSDKTARIWSADGRGAPQVLDGHKAHVAWAAFSPDGQRIVTASYDKTARIWSADGRGAPRVLEGHKAQVTWAAFSPDGQRIVTASYDKTARIWSADGHGAPRVFHGHEAEVNAAAFSPDGQRIVTASMDKTVRIWNADGTGEPQIFRGYEGIIHSAAFSPDGARIVTASEDRTIRVFRVDGMGEPLILRGEDAFNAATFSPDGQRIVAASDDRTARVWSDLEPLKGAADPRLWAATTYCMPVERRIRLLDIPEELAFQSYQTCLRLVREAQQIPAARGPARSSLEP